MKHIISTAPLTISAKNCEAATGLPWRWIREKAADLGVDVITIDGKSLILAEPLLAALRGLAPIRDEDAGVAPADPAEAVRAALGRVRLVG